jgi:glycosyltransferase involved in cell wall biosynthesis
VDYRGRSWATGFNGFGLDFYGRVARKISANRQTAAKAFNQPTFMIATSTDSTQIFPVPEHPLLSVCIPTYNRAHCLEITLPALVIECENHATEVEIVVSDNASTDETLELADRYASCRFLRWHRQPRNIGGPANIAACAMELAQGDYCWIVGDDDLVLPGAVGRILAALQDNMDCNVFFVNFAQADFTDIAQLAVQRDPSFIPSADKLECPEPASRRYDSPVTFLQTGRGRIDYFSAILGLVVRVKYWQEHGLSPVELAKHDPFLSFEISFPHLAILFGKVNNAPVYCVATPCSLLGMGAREWAHEWSRIIADQYPRIIELYSSSGAAVNYTEIMRARLLELLLQELPRHVRGGVPWSRIATPLFRWVRESSLRSGPVRKVLAQKLFQTLGACCPALAARAYGRLPENLKRRWRQIKKLR